MNETQTPASTPTPEILPQQPQQPVQEMPSAPKRPTASIASAIEPYKKYAIIFIGGIAGLTILSIIASSVSKTVSTLRGPTPTATMQVTPTPTILVNQSLAPYATDSAFIEYEKQVDALPGVIQGAVLQDASVLPPVLNLPLGF